jgi:hypothetical protein
MPYAYTINEVPLSPNPQSFEIALVGINYKVDLSWNAHSQNWNIDINDTLGSPIVQGIPLVAGADLLQQFEYLNFGGALMVQSDSDLSAPPAFSTLGITDHLYFITFL